MASVTSDAADNAHRRDRAVIAAQACQTCRTRKSKCDERRPKCSLCSRLDVECEYREPLPTKKDKTLVHMQDQIARQEGKSDNIIQILLSMRDEMRTGFRQQQRPYPQGLIPSPQPLSGGNSGYETVETPQNQINEIEHLTAPHKIILWPSIYVFLMRSGIPATSDIQHIMNEGTGWFVNLDRLKNARPLPSDEGLPSFPLNSNTRESSGLHVAFPALSMQEVQQLTKEYFETFNLLFPLLDQEDFFNNVVSKVLAHGYAEGDPAAVLALLVFALGMVARDGVHGQPISAVNGQNSGFRGGTIQRPPGLAIFNEARRRIGFIASTCSLELIQIHLLMAIYSETNARHLDFWSWTIAASKTCLVVIKCQNPDWNTAEGDLIKRAYWSCVICEDFFHLELDLPRTPICSLEDQVPLPYSQAGIDRHGVPTELRDERSHFQYSFLAMINLRKQITRINGITQEYESTPRRDSPEYGGPNSTVIREVTRQLENWRSVLPRPLQWSDNDKFNYSNQDPNVRGPNEPLFRPDHGPLPIRHRYNLDIVTAQLRTRFYYARYMIHRPFIYKALHFPERITPDDARNCATAIQAACMWPVSLAPPKDKKRLIPHIFAWTQNFVGILLILRMTTENDCLAAICEEHLNFAEIERAALLMLDWMRDVSQLDGTAQWAWQILEPLYSQWGSGTKGGSPNDMRWGH